MLAPVVLLAAAVTSVPHVRELIGKDQWKDALAAATALAREQPGPEATAVLGEALYRAGAIDEAGEALAPLASAEEAPARALAQLGLVRVAQGRDDDAAELLERAAVKAPSDPWVLLRAAGAAPTRARATELLNAYIAHGLGEDPDRIEGARGTLRLYAALGERKIWIPVERPERLSIPLKPIVGGSGYYVEAALAGKKKIRLLLDTGSSGLFVVERAVKKGGLVPLSDETVFAGGGSGRASSSRGLLTRLDLGGLVFADALVTTTRDEFDPQGRIHGVLGISAFAGYRITLDLAKGRLLLEPPGEPLVRARGGEASAGLFLFDTGATQSMVDSKFAATVGGAQIDSPTAVHTYGGNIAGASIVRGMSLAFQDLKRAGAFNTADLTMRSRLGGVEVSGYLGMDVLAGCAIVVDTKSHRVAVTPPPARP
jgi:predicted aspartyl protease